MCGSYKYLCLCLFYREGRGGLGWRKLILSQGEVMEKRLFFARVIENSVNVFFYTVLNTGVVGAFYGFRK